QLLVTVNAVNLFRLVVNPHDFGQSVENLFHLSFLVQDGTCALHIRDDGEPLICICEFQYELLRAHPHSRLNLDTFRNDVSGRKTLRIFSPNSFFLYGSYRL
ncbi:hypothetical protein DEU56DRAFT_747401, partial [Suillus clintonianus]|uniref:uncharacterized protein n=1 Tax=Suillus clintonianus TaxID=1904413 RepID=UPI001B85C85C